MATVDLYWQESRTAGGGATHNCELKARKDGDALIMEARDRGRAIVRLYEATAYYRLGDRQHRIPLYDNEGFRSLDDAKEALAQWYVNHAPTLLMTLAG